MSGQERANLTGRLMGPYLVLGNRSRDAARSGLDLFRVRCQGCGGERLVRRSALWNARGRGCRSCPSCRIEAHRVSTWCSGCGVPVSRPKGTRLSYCDACRRRRKTDVILRRRALSLGRVCGSCGRGDEEVDFANNRECVVCARRGARNGRCAAGHSLYRTVGGCPTCAVAP